MPSSDGRVKIVRRRLSDGSIKEYRYDKKPNPTSRIAPNTVGALIQAYRRSPEWFALTDKSRKHYGYYIRDLEELAHMPLIAVRRRTLLAMRDAIAAERGKGAANAFAQTSGTVFAWARDRDWIEHSPLNRVRALPGGHLLAWTAEEADLAAAELPEPLRRVVVLGRYTGQRRGDLIAMTWGAYDGTSIRVQQEKGAIRHRRPALMIPVHPALKVELDAWKKSATSTLILTSERGVPWKANHLTSEFRRVLPGKGFRPGLNVHGLRKLAATALADAGCTAHEIASVTGHKTLAMVQLYTASADQVRLATSAISRLENTKRKTAENDG